MTKEERIANREKLKKVTQEREKRLPYVSMGNERGIVCFDSGKNLLEIAIFSNGGDPLRRETLYIKLEALREFIAGATARYNERVQELNKVKVEPLLEASLIEL